MLVSSRHDNAAVQKLMLCLRPGNTVLTENLPYMRNCLKNSGDAVLVIYSIQRKTQEIEYKLW